MARNRFENYMQQPTRLTTLYCPEEAGTGAAVELRSSTNDGTEVILPGAYFPARSMQFGGIWTGSFAGTYTQYHTVGAPTQTWQFRVKDAGADCLIATPITLFADTPLTDFAFAPPDVVLWVIDVRIIPINSLDQGNTQMVEVKASLFDVSSQGTPTSSLNAKNVDTKYSYMTLDQTLEHDIGFSFQKTTAAGWAAGGNEWQCTSATGLHIGQRSST